MNLNITQSKIQFASDTTLALVEPKWELVDDSSMHVITEQGVYYITLSDYSLNGNKYSSSSDAIAYLSSIK